MAELVVVLCVAYRYSPPTGGEADGVPSGTKAYYSFTYSTVHVIVLNSFDVSR
jgi:hypothetical protein